MTDQTQTTTEPVARWIEMAATPFIEGGLGDELHRRREGKPQRHRHDRSPSPSLSSRGGGVVINWIQRQRLRALVGQPVDDLEGDDYALFWGLMTESRVAIHDGNVARIPVAYGDGKKSPYGVTYADELIGDFA